MVSKKKSKGKPTPSRSKVSRPSVQPRITLETPKAPAPVREQLLKKLNLKPNDILAEKDLGSEFVFVTKNGMKIRVKK